MGLFTFRHSERNSKLETALQGITFSRDVRLSYLIENKNITSPIYLLPMDAYTTVIYGEFLIDGKLVKVPVGFSRKKEFLVEEHFRLNLDGRLVTESWPNDDTIYLTLKLTDLRLKLGRQKGGDVDKS